MKRETFQHPGRIIGLLRNAAGLSQRELAEHLGVTRSYLAEVETERRDPGLVFLRAVSGRLSIPVALLLVDDTSPSPVMKDIRRLLETLLEARLAAAGGDGDG